MWTMAKGCPVAWPHLAGLRLPRRFRFGPGRTARRIGPVSLVGREDRWRDGALVAAALGGFLPGVREDAHASAEHGQAAGQWRGGTPPRAGDGGGGAGVALRRTGPGRG